MQRYRVKLTFTEPILGTVTKDPDVYKTYIQAKAVKEAEKTGVELTEEMLEQEVGTVEKLEEKGWTGFHRLPDETPILYDYVIKGFFKDAAGMLRRVEKTESSKVKAYKKIIDGLVFVEPRQIPLQLNGHEMTPLERPLRASTPQGERVALARSDTCPAGTVIEFTVIVLGEVSEALLREWLDYGQYRGLGQWRNGGWGSFQYEMEEMPG